MDSSGWTRHHVADRLVDANRASLVRERELRRRRQRMELPARRRDDLDLPLRRPHRRREADLPRDLLTQLAACGNPDAAAPCIRQREIDPPRSTADEDELEVR